MADTGASTKRSHDHDHPPNEHHKRVRSSNADETGPYASMAAAPPAASPPESLRAKPSFYQRQLPEACVSFSSPHGRRLLMESLSSESLDTHIYFDLSAQFRTQEEPTFCGLSTLVMCLNALKLDPNQHWKGPWRWYHESMLDCCKPIEDVKGAGITIDEFTCLARCNGAAAHLYRPDSGTACDNNGSCGDKANGIRSEGGCSARDENDRGGGSSSGGGCGAPEISLDMFREQVRTSCASGLAITVVSYDRATLGQSGSGHFSPIAAFHALEDKALILDVARFKYPPHWVDLATLYEALRGIDSSTQKPRGFVMLSKGGHAGTVLTLSVKRRTCCKRSASVDAGTGTCASAAADDAVPAPPSDGCGEVCADKVTLVDLIKSWRRECSGPAAAEGPSAEQLLRSITQQLVAQEKLNEQISTIHKDADVDFERLQENHRRAVLELFGSIRELPLTKALKRLLASNAEAERAAVGNVEARLEHAGWVAVTILVWFGEDLCRELAALGEPALHPNSAHSQVNLASEWFDISRESVSPPLQREIQHLRIQRRELASLVAGCCNPLDSSASEFE